MRLRNVKNKESIIFNSPYYIKKYSKDVFEKTQPLHIEIGMGKGKFISEMALKYPNINFIGIEKSDSVLALALKKIPENIPNLRVMLMDASDIDQVFDHDVSRLYLNFSDPWPKKRHQERRLTSKTFLNKYNSIFEREIDIIFKTDNRQLFQYSIMVFNSLGYHFEELSLDLHQEKEIINVETEYEMRFSSKGYPIYLIKVTRK